MIYLAIGLSIVIGCCLLRFGEYRANLRTDRDPVVRVKGPTLYVQIMALAIGFGLLFTDVSVVTVIICAAISVSAGIIHYGAIIGTAIAASNPPG